MSANAVASLARRSAGKSWLAACPERCQPPVAKCAGVGRLVAKTALVGFGTTAAVTATRTRIANHLRMAGSYSRLSRPTMPARPMSRPLGGCMFVIELVYKVPLAKIDAHMKPHVAFLNKYLRGWQFPGVRPEDPARWRDHPGRGTEPAGDRDDRPGRSLRRARTGRRADHRVSRQPAGARHPAADRNLTAIRARRARTGG